MKRIGILTYHCVPNFGAQLQALSTIGYLSKHGYDPIMLHWYPQDLEDYYYKRVPKEQNELQMRFAETHMPISKLCRNIDDLCAEIESLHLDAIFLGSDALFDYTPECLRYNFSIRKLRHIPLNITSNHRLPNPFWGSFNDKLRNPIPLVGFSISSQNMLYNKLNSSERLELNRLLRLFCGITTRDEWTKSLVEDVGGRNDVTITPDPVFSFNQNIVKTINKEDLCEKFNLPDNYVLISFLYPLLSDEFVNKIINLVEERTGAECVSFPMPDKLRKFNTKHTIKLPLDPLDWYYLIKYSRGYIGERMHPIVVSLHNSVPFFCFDQYGTYKTIIPRMWTRFIPESSKIFDILTKADFTNNLCFYSKLSEITPDLVVEHFLSFDREKCAQFARSRLMLYNEGMERLMKML